MTIVALYQINRYKVDFVDWDGSILKVDSAEYLSAAIPSIVPIRTGYTFIGWDKEVTSVTQDTTITALYKINSYQVIYADWDGTILKSDSVEYLSTAIAPMDPTRIGYTFVGWDKEVTSVTQDTTITAFYQINRYKVDFVDWDGTILRTDSVEYLASAIAPMDPAREGYTFIGWDKEVTSVTQDTTIIALYQINRYKVDFADWDGTILKTDSVEYLSSAIAPEDPTRIGYTFAGWDKEVTSVMQDTTITAMYTINYYPITFLNYNGVLLSEQTVAYNTAAVEPELPTREGYYFIGWTSNIEHVTDRTYAIALYEKIGIIVTYKSEEGSVIASENVDMHIPTPPMVAGKTFSGWLTEIANVEDGIVLRATYTFDNPTTESDVTIVPGATTAGVTFPYVTGAVTYVLVIRDLFGFVVCKIMFNSNGYLTCIR